ncbi:MAG: methionyl-tRNA formyltransferase [Clostridia bacterium]|nr:methionyl-tRNA formyltransferase [Clostridia bacterium]
MRIAFLGTPEFALPSLNALISRRHTICVFTQPDRPVGRRQVLTPPPVKALARQHGLPVMQFERIKSAEGVAALKSFAPDLCVTAAFGQLLSRENLSVPRHGTINVHASLLPKYRGASPIQSAIIEGETETGVTIMMTDIGMDTGDILNSDSCPIRPDETAGQLSERLAVIGSRLLLAVIDSISNGTLVRVPQDEKLATRCKPLTRDSGRIDFSLPRLRVHNLVRGVNPWPGAFAYLDELPIKIWATRFADCVELADAPFGTLMGSAKQGLFVRCADGWLELCDLQLSGGKRMSGKSILCGNDLCGRRLT